jgi:hypothetical protein
MKSRVGAPNILLINSCNVAPRHAPRRKVAFDFCCFVMVKNHTASATMDKTIKFNSISIFCLHLARPIVIVRAKPLLVKVCCTLSSINFSVQPRQHILKYENKTSRVHHYTYYAHQFFNVYKSFFFGSDRFIKRNRITI